MTKRNLAPGDLLQSLTNRVASGLRAGNAASGAEDPRAENIIWIFGTIRTGSTWLGQMMGDLKGHAMWNEPRVGELFGHFFYERASHRRGNENFIMGLRYKDVWLRSIRTLILDSVSARYPEVVRGSYLIIKEPSGSIGAPLLAEALPESRLVFLIRDPRDMVASALDATREDSWVYKLEGRRKRQETMKQKERKGPAQDTEAQLDRYARRRAKLYLQSVGNSKKAYDSHEGPKTLVRYEELRADTLATMKRIYSELNIEVDEKRLARAVEKHSWENVPEEEKGPGKFKRKATPGGWREDLTPRQVKIVEELTAPLIEEFYPE